MEVSNVSGTHGFIVQEKNYTLASPHDQNFFQTIRPTNLNHNSLLHVLQACNKNVIIKADTISFLSY